jgi:hypothetical protein
MELCLGPEWEKHKFSEPTVAVAPKGVPHCPLVTEKVYKPFGHFHLALAPKYAGSQAKLEGTTDGTRYSHLVKPMKVQKGVGGADAVQFASKSGHELEGLPINFVMGLFNKTGRWDPGKGAHLHPYNECLIFFGNNASDLSYLGAELTIEIGKEHEKYTINQPTVVSIPKGTPHGPIVCNKVEKPYRVMQVGLAAEYKSGEV